MSWEPTLITANGSPLGSADELRTAIDRVFPGTAWELAPGGEEMLKQMEQLGTSIADEWRAMLLQTPPRWLGVYDSEAVSVEFHVSCGERVQWVNITSRGDHSKSQTLLKTLADARGWAIKEA